MARALSAAAVLVLAGWLGVTSHAAAKHPPTMRVLAGHWFELSVHSTYSMHASVDRSDDCPEFMHVQTSETRTLGTGARLFGFEVLMPGQGPVPSSLALIFSRHAYVVGQRLGARDFNGVGLRAPAVWKRSLTGTYEECNGSPQTLAPPGCGTFSTPNLQIFPGISDQRPFHGHVDLSYAVNPRSSLPRTRCVIDYNLLPYEIEGFLGDVVEDQGADLRCPTIATVLARPRTVCRYRASDNPGSGLDRNVKVTATAVLTRTR